MRGTTWVVPVILLLAATALAGCVGSGDGPETGPASPSASATLPDPVRVLEDAPGDALARNPRTVHLAGGLTCDDAIDEVPDAACWTPVREATDQVGAGGPPELDILGVTVHEKPSTLVIDIELATVDATFADVLVDVEQGLEIGVCWNTEELQCDVDFRNGTTLSWPVNPFIIVARGPGGVEVVLEHVYWAGPSCGGEQRCRQGVPVTLVEGSPGAVRFEVPRGIVPGTLAGDSLEGLVAYTYGFEHFSEDELYAENPATTPMRATFVRSLALGGGHIVDISDPAEPYAMQTLEVPPVSALHEVADPTDEPFVGSPEGDIHAIHVVEDAESLTFAMKLGELAEEPFNHTLQFGASLAHGAAFRYERVVSAGQAVVDAVVCPADGCDRSLPAPLDTGVVYGAPGWLNLTVPRSALGHPARGDQWAQVSAMVLALDGESVEGPEGTSASFKEATSFDAHILPLLRPLQLDTVGAGEPGLVIAGTAEDDVGDLPLEQQATRGRDNYDIRVVEAAAVSPGVTSFTISLAQLTAEPIPDGYDAVVYAVAVDREARGAAMTYFLRPRSGPAQSYCAEDTLVLTPRPQDPSIAISTPIESLINYVSTDQSGRGGGTGGSITFLAPSECFGLSPDAPLEVQRMAGATFFLKDVPNLEDRVIAVDRSEDSGPFTVRPLAVAAATPSFWQAPFGMENGWDILGAALAILTVLVTGALFWRRRRQLRRYIEAIDAIEATHAADPAARAEALIALRARLDTALVRHRVSESHYSIILERLRTRITSARLMSVGERIYSLPTNLALRIERLLDDGRLTAEEHRALQPALARAKMPKETRELLQERLATWVREDATAGAA